MDTMYTGHELNEEEIRDMLTAFNPNDFYTEDKYYKSENTYITDLVNSLKKQYPKTKYNLVRSGFYKKLCDQAANYLVGEDVSISGLRDKPVLDINKYLQEMCIRAKKNGRAWIHFYIYENELKYKLIPPTEIIPIYDNQYEDLLLYVIRFYRLQDGKDERTRVEVWDNESVTYYLEDLKTHTYFLDYMTTTEPRVPHIMNVGYVMGQASTQEGTSWGRPPFVELKLNYDRRAVLWDIKDDIDAYDKVMSGFMDNVDDIRDAILLIKDRGGDTLSEIKEKMDAYRALFVENDGDASYLTLDIPVEARNTLKTEYRANIYEFANGVDMAAFRTSGGNITNVYIQALFQDMDGESRGFSKHVDDFILEVLKMYNIFLELQGKATENLEDVEITYNKSIPSNIAENIDAVNKSKGIISDATLTEVHPLVKDPEIEKDRLDAELMAGMVGGASDGEENNPDIPASGSEIDSSNKKNNPGQQETD